MTSMGLADAIALLQANLDQEVHTSEELQKTLQKILA
jgi:ferritin-like metal-binding protein YciE